MPRISEVKSGTTQNNEMTTSTSDPILPEKLPREKNKLQN